jgi:putative membrane protein
MSRNLRRFGSLSLIAICAQALAFSALAQTTAPENTRDTTRQSAGATSTTTGTGTSADATGARSDRAAQQRAQPSAAKNTQMASVTPESFASKAAVLSTAEVELSQLALNNTKNEEIRIFAERMIKDHTAANEKLKKIAAQEDITVPQSLDAEQRAVKQKLASLKGDAFDREYRKEMAKGHDKAVALFESASQNEQMPEELREFAASTLRTLEDHQEDAHDMQEDAMEEGA